MNLPLLVDAAGRGRLTGWPRRRPCIAAIVLASLAVESAEAASDPPAATAPPPTSVQWPSPKPDKNSTGPDAEVSSQPLTPGGLYDELKAQKQRLKDFGVTFSLREDSEFWANITAPGGQPVSYNGLTTASVDLDLEKLIGWTGAEFFASGFSIHGHGPSRSFVGNQQLVSNLEAAPSIKLYDLWIDQSLFEKRLSIRIGQEGANDEFMDTAYGTLFINSSFGFPALAADNLPSGGPNYPLATPMVRLAYKPDDNLAVLGAVYNGDPAPPGPGDPQIRDRNGTAFRLDGNTLSLAELQYSPPSDAADRLPTTYKIGAWYSTSPFADKRFDDAGGLLASPTSSGTPLRRKNNWSVYAVVDQLVWQNPDAKDRGIGVFLQAMGGPSDRNISNVSFMGGMTWWGPFAQRPDDAFGLAFTYLGISPALRQYSRDLVAFGLASSSYQSNETVLEMTYQAPVTPWLVLQPDLQYVINPNAGIPNNFGAGPFNNALVAGVRLTIKL